MIELLVVIAIIAILAALPLPALARAKGKANTVKKLWAITNTPTAGSPAHSFGNLNDWLTDPDPQA